MPPIEDDNPNTAVDIDNDDLDAFSAEFYNNKKPDIETSDTTSVASAETPDETDQTGEPETEDETSEEEEVETPATDEDETEEDEEEEVAEEEPAPKPKKKSAQERINELTAKAREAERREADVLRKLEALEAAVSAKEKTPEPVRPQFEPDAPQPDAVDEAGEDLYPLGEFDPLFIRDLTRYTIQKEQKRANEEAEVTRLETEKTAAFEVLKTEWNVKLDAVSEELPDVREKITELDTSFSSLAPDYGEYLATTIMTLDNGPQVLYYLSQNIGEAQKIVAAGATAATLALGRLDARFTKPKVEEKKRNEKKGSDAPPPPKQPTRGSGVAKIVPADTDDLEAFEAEFYNRKK